MRFAATWPAYDEAAGVVRVRSVIVGAVDAIILTRALIAAGLSARLEPARRDVAERKEVAVALADVVQLRTVRWGEITDGTN